MEWNSYTMEWNSAEHQLLKVDSRVVFLDNLSQHFKSDEFSDVTLIVGGKYYPAHKTILATASIYFKRMFYGMPWNEESGEEVELLEDEDCEQVFETFLKYFYTGLVSVNLETVIPIVTLADKYDVEGLKDICSSFMVNFLDKARDIKIALGWVVFAAQMRLNDLEDRCYNVICCNFEKACHDINWCSLPIENVLVVLKRSDLVVSNEYVVYCALQKWLLDKDVSQQQLSSILPHIQFKNMRVEQIRLVELSPLEARNQCKTDHLLHPYLYDAYRYLAIGDLKIPGCTIEHSKLQRCYTIDNSAMKTVMFDRLFDCAVIAPTCTWSDEPSKYRWELLKQEGSDRYQIRMPEVSRMIFDMCKGKRVVHLRSILSGQILLNVTFVFRNQDGANLFAMRDSLQVCIPEKRGTVVELPDLRGDQARCSPHDVMYTFDIQKI